jgi:ParB-like chromosome segregation protein Spo0J
MSWLGQRTDTLLRSRQDSYLNIANDIKAIPPKSVSFSADFWSSSDLPSSPWRSAEYTNDYHTEQRRKIAMQVEMRPIDTIRPYQNNPRQNDAAVDAVAASIREFGFRQPIVVDEEGVIIVGHTRYKAAIKVGLEEVPIHVAVGLTPAQAKAYRLADNQTATLAQWDDDKLVQELAQLQEMDFDLALTGFSSEDLQRLLEEGAGVGLTDPDAVPEPPDEAITQPGDLWLLGKHRLLCGDSSKPADVDRLLDGAVIHLANTDPPYNVKVEPRSNNAIAAGLSSFQGTTHHQSLDLARHPEKAQPTEKKLRAKDRPLANDFVSDEEFNRLLQAWFGNLARVLLPGRAFYVWGGYANVGNYPRSSRPRACTSRRPSFGTNSIRS